MFKNAAGERILGPAVLFAALFLPGYIYQNAEAAAMTLSEPSLLAQNLLLGVPQALLILFVILKCGHVTKETAGLVPLRARDAWKIIAGIAGLFIIVIPSALVNRDSAGSLFTSVAPDKAQPGLLILLALVSLAGAYREELFFRSYLLTELEPFGKATAIMAGSLLFGVGHLYQGAGAFVVTALIGLFLSWLFLRTRNVHVVALTHGIYNYLVILAATLLR